MRTAIVALLFTLALLIPAGVANAKGKSKGLNGKYHGTIVDRSRGRIIVNIGVNRDERVVFAIDGKTHVSGFGKQGTLADLVTGEVVDAQVKSGHVDKIEVTALPPSN